MSYFGQQRTERTNIEYVDLIKQTYIKKYKKNTTIKKKKKKQYNYQ